MSEALEDLCGRCDNYAVIVAESERYGPMCEECTERLRGAITLRPLDG